MTAIALWQVGALRRKNSSAALVGSFKRCTGLGAPAAAHRIPIDIIVAELPDPRRVRLNERCFSQRRYGALCNGAALESLAFTSTASLSDWLRAMCVRTMTLRMVSSFRMHATSASFLGLPASARRR